MIHSKNCTCRDCLIGKTIDDTAQVECNGLLCAWIQETTEALKIAGFMVREWQGFPLVEMPKDFTEKVRLLKLSLPQGGVKTIYSEGMLVTPNRINT